MQPRTNPRCRPILADLEHTAGSLDLTGRNWFGQRTVAFAARGHFGAFGAGLAG
jgi:hypothetical protein